MRRTEYIYLQCKIRHVYMNFRQNFSRKKILSPFQKKTLAETVHDIPKGLRKGTPFKDLLLNSHIVAYCTCVYTCTYYSTHIAAFQAKTYRTARRVSANTMPMRAKPLKVLLKWCVFSWVIILRFSRSCTNLYL